MDILNKLKERWSGIEYPFLMHSKGELRFSEIAEQYMDITASYKELASQYLDDISQFRDEADEASTSALDSAISAADYAISAGESAQSAEDIISDLNNTADSVQGVTNLLSEMDTITQAINLLHENAVIRTDLILSLMDDIDEDVKTIEDKKQEVRFLQICTAF